MLILYFYSNPKIGRMINITIEYSISNVKNIKLTESTKARNNQKEEIKGLVL